MKDAVGSESPWTKTIISSILKNYVAKFKQAITDPNGGSDFSQLARAKESPLIQLIICMIMHSLKPTIKEIKQEIESMLH